MQSNWLLGLWGMFDSDGTSPSALGTAARQSTPRNRRAAARDSQRDEDDEDDDEIEEEGDCVGGERAGGLTRDVWSGETEERQSAQERICILRVDPKPKITKWKEAPGGVYVTLNTTLRTKEEKSEAG